MSFTCLVMFFIPNNLAYKRNFRIRPNRHVKNRLFLTNFTSTFQIIAAESGLLNSNQLKFISNIFSKHLKKSAKVTFNIFPHLTKTSKPVATRMGKGKGSIET